MKNKIFRKSAGFTLIEMLIVIAIIAILSSVFLVGLKGFRSSAYDSRRISDLQKVQSYLETVYNINKRAYPVVDTWSALKQSIKTLLDVDIPNDPIAGNTYIYCVDNTDKQSYILGAKLSSPGHSALSESYHGSVFSGCNLDCTEGSGWLCVKF
ncbi:MAG: prepilin-type N-terminal cleavage/methylation domain-containing protein [Patescibacteria group bacterium]